MLGSEEMKFKAQDDGIFVLGKGVDINKLGQKALFLRSIFRHKE